MTCKRMAEMTPKACHYTTCQKDGKCIVANDKRWASLVRPHGPAPSTPRKRKK